MNDVVRVSTTRRQKSAWGTSFVCSLWFSEIPLRTGRTLRLVRSRKPSEAGRKNASPAQRLQTRRGDPHPHALSLACNAFFVRPERPASTVFFANEPNRSACLRAYRQTEIQSGLRGAHDQFAAGVGSLKHGVSPRSRKSGDAIPRREFVPRDPCRSNPQERCMPRWRARASSLLAAASAGLEREPDFPPC